jgi:hypothetical protein
VDIIFVVPGNTKGSFSCKLFNGIFPTFGKLFVPQLSAGLWRATHNMVARKFSKISMAISVPNEQRKANLTVQNHDGSWGHLDYRHGEKLIGFMTMVA